MSIILTIDTSGLALSAAIADEKQLLACGGKQDGRNHSLGLLPLVQDLLAACGLSLGQMDAFAVTLGPGSFTGLRIGAATAKAWADALDKPLIGLSSAAAQAATVGGDGLICPVFDARRDQVYSALFRGRERLLPDLAIAPAELAEKLREYEQPVLFAGDGLPVYGETLAAALGERFRACADPQQLYLAKGGAELARSKFAAHDFTPSAQLLPLYLRPSEAEEHRLAMEQEAAHG